MLDLGESEREIDPNYVWGLNSLQFEEVPCTISAERPSGARHPMAAACAAF